MGNFLVLLLTNEDEKKAVAIQATAQETFGDRVTCTLLSDDILELKHDPEKEVWSLPSGEEFGYLRTYGGSILNSLKDDYDLTVL